VGGKAPGGAWGLWPQKLTTHMLFCHGFKNVIAIFAFIAYKCSIWNGRKINLEAEKWYGKQQCLPIWHKKWAGICPRCPMLHCQWMCHFNRLILEHHLVHCTAVQRWDLPLTHVQFVISKFVCWCVTVVFLLKCAVQTYAWGKQGCNSEVARLMKNADDGVVIDENTTYAEVMHYCICWY